MLDIIIVIAIAILASAIVLLARRRSRPRRDAICPRCGAAELRCVQFIRATVMIDGRRAPDSWSYHQCATCGARFKQHRGPGFSEPSADEWACHCSSTSAPP